MDDNPRVSIIADSINEYGDRITTLELRNGGTTVITGTGFHSVQQVASTPTDLDPATFAQARPAITAALHASTATLITAQGKDGGIHVPYITRSERRYLTPSQQACISVARCVRATDPKRHRPRNVPADIALYHALISGRPPRMQPVEHVAVVGAAPVGRYTGWVSLRHLFQHRGVDAL